MPNAEIEPLRSLGFAGISGTYADLGTAFSNPVRLFCITNNTDGDLLFSRDANTDELFVAAGSFKLFDLQSNMNTVKEEKFVFKQGTLFSVKQSTAPTAGDVYIEVIV